MLFQSGPFKAWVVVAVAFAIALAADNGFAQAPTAAGPLRVRPERFQPLLMPGGDLWGFSVQALAEGRLAITAIVSKDNGHAWGQRQTLVELPKVQPPQTVWGDVVPLVDRKNGELHGFILKWDQSDKKAPFPKLSLWHLAASPPYRKWTEPKQLFDGYIGALLSAVQSPKGTIVCPFAFMTTRTYSTPAAGLMEWVFMGQHTTTSVYSTDGGKTFHRSNDVNVPAAILIGNEGGALEPICLPLKDGRIWMLMRTQLGRLWESFSKDGIRWEPAQPSRFLASDSPASLTRLSDGRIVTIWNCCQRYPYAYGGRQVLHAAISGDDGRTWNGFREVLRDPKRLEPAIPIKGDYGSGYPVATPTRDGKLLVATGQGATSGVFLLDPAWLTETSQRDDFHNGLDAWSAYGTKGVRIVAHPPGSKTHVLSLGRTDREFPAAAVWNFPNGRSGTLRVRFQILPGLAETAVTLTDHFSSPFDEEAELNGLFTLSLKAGELIANGQTLNASTWHDLDLGWDFTKRVCRVSIDGIAWRAIPQARLTSEGANYLRFRITNREPVSGGLLVESVFAKVVNYENQAADSDSPR